MVSITKERKDEVLIFVNFLFVPGRILWGSMCAQWVWVEKTRSGFLDSIFPHSMSRSAAEFFRGRSLGHRQSDK